MPCNSDHMEPSHHERESVKIIGFLKEFGHGLGDKVDCYGRVHTIHTDTAKLCKLCTEATIQGRMGMASLELQIWWRDHQVADKKKEQTKQQKKRLEFLKESALAKLTPEDREALGLIQKEWFLQGK